MKIKYSSKSGLVWALQLSVVMLVLLWIFPTAGLLVSSFRTADQISTGGWWRALFTSEQNIQFRTSKPSAQKSIDNLHVIEGNLLTDNPDVDITSWGISSLKINEFSPGEKASLRNGGTLIVQSNGEYRMENTEPFEGSRGQRVFVTAEFPPDFTLDNYHHVLFDAKNVEGMGKAFINTFTVTIPSTVIPILMAAFAAYALAWMRFPGRYLLITIIVGLLVVPLQLALIPLLKLHLNIGLGKGYAGVWLAHTGFGMPLAIYLLRNYMTGLPKDIIENARIDGATEFQIFTKIIIPLSFPALASFAIFQFLWTWNDLLVAKVFLIDASGDTSIMTSRIVELLGTRGGDWEVLATSAFVSMAVPLLVFFALQKYLVRGLLSGSVK